MLGSVSTCFWRNLTSREENENRGAGKIPNMLNFAAGAPTKTPGL